MAAASSTAVPDLEHRLNFTFIDLTLISLLLSLDSVTSFNKKFLYRINVPPLPISFTPFYSD